MHDKVIRQMFNMHILSYLYVKSDNFEIIPYPTESNSGKARYLPLR